MTPMTIGESQVYTTIFESVIIKVTRCVAVQKAREMAVVEEDWVFLNCCHEYLGWCLTVLSHS